MPNRSDYVIAGDRYAYHYRTQPVGPGGQAEPVTQSGDEATFF
jgi:hypothetical protein